MTGVQTCALPISEEEGCTHYSELPEDKNEVNYRSKRSDKFKGPENCLFDIANEPWVGTAQ